VPRYVFKKVWTFEAFDDADARAKFFLEYVGDKIPEPYRTTLNKAGSDENILERWQRAGVDIRQERIDEEVES
jgi:hypothetical protein